MRGTAKALKEDKGMFIRSLIKGSLIALSISLVGICIFAFILRFIDIDAGMIRPINQVIKIVSILMGVMMGMKNIHEMGLISGFLIGCIYTFLAFLVFSLLNGSLHFDASLINDLLFGGIAGGIAGIISVNILKKSK